MKVETTISIEADLLEQADRAASSFHSRSEVFENALQIYLPTLKKKPIKRKLNGKKEIKAINGYADEHREELLETLSLSG